MNGMIEVIDWSKTQCADITTNTSSVLISDLIKAGESFIYYHQKEQFILAIEKAIQNFKNAKISSHCNYVKDPLKILGAEMTFPKSQQCDLKEYGLFKGTHINHIYRCPYMDDKICSKASDIRKAMNDWMEKNFGEKYGIDTLLDFLVDDELKTQFIDFIHNVCSIWVIRGWYEVVQLQFGFDLKLPATWFVKNKQGITIGLVSPLNVDIVLGNMKLAIPFTKYIQV